MLRLNKVQTLCSRPLIQNQVPTIHEKIVGSIFMRCPRSYRTCEWLTGAEWRNDFQVFWSRKNLELLKSCKFQVWIDLIPSVLLIDRQFHWIIQRTRIPNSRSSRGIGRKKGQFRRTKILAAVDVGRTAKLNIFWGKCPIKKQYIQSFGDENVMSSVPNDIFRVGTEFCDNYSA